MTAIIQALRRSPAPTAFQKVADAPLLARSLGPGAAVRTSARPSARTPSTRRVVVLDDTPAMRELYRCVLQQEFPRVEIREFADGDAAWRELTRANPALFLTDITHPLMSCAAMLAALAARQARFRIVVASGAMPLHRARLAELGRSLDLVLLTKPWQATTLLAALRSALG